jgi:putative metalloprotease
MVKLLLILGGIALLGWAQLRFSLWRLGKDLDARSRPLEDPALEPVIRKLGETLDLPELKVRLYDMPAVNGLAAPDGRILITTGLYDKFRMGLIRAEEVASVVAHELGHLALGHHRRRLVDWTGQNVAKMALGMILSRFVPFVGFHIANLLGALVMSRLSRRDEFEADRYATALMLRAGYGPEPQVAMFRKLARMVPGPKGAAWLASHPPVEERVAAVEANARAWEAA